MLNIKLFVQPSTALALIFSLSFTSALHASPGSDDEDFRSSGSSKTNIDKNRNQSPLPTNKVNQHNKTQKPDNLDRPVKITKIEYLLNSHSNDSMSTSSDPKMAQKINVPAPNSFVALVDMSNNNNGPTSSEPEMLEKIDIMLSSFFKHENINNNNNNPHIGLSPAPEMTQKKDDPIALSSFFDKVENKYLRQLKWLRGPHVGTLDNFKFNAALLYACEQLFFLRDTQNRVRLENLTKYIETHFMEKYEEPATKVLKFLNSAKTNCNREAPWDSSDLGLLPREGSQAANTGEKSLMRLLKYLTDPKFNPVKDPFYGSSDLSDPAIRDYMVRQKIEQINKQLAITPQSIYSDVGKKWGKDTVEFYNFVYKYAADSHKHFDFYSQAFHIYNVINNFPMIVKLGAEMIEKFPDKVDVCERMMVVTALFRIDREKAIKGAKKIFEEFPNQLTIDNCRPFVDGFAGYKNQKKIAELYCEIFERFPNECNPDDYEKAAHYYLREGYYKEATQVYKELFKKYPDNLKAYMNASLAYFGKCKFSKAFKLQKKIDDLAKTREEKNAAQINEFILLHSDFKGYKIERNNFLESNVLGGTEKKTYKSFFKSTFNSTLQSLDSYIKKYKTFRPNSNIGRIIFYVGLMMCNQKAQKLFQTNWEILRGEGAQERRTTPLEAVDPSLSDSDSYF